MVAAIPRPEWNKDDFLQRVQEAFESEDLGHLGQFAFIYFSKDKKLKGICHAEWMTLSGMANYLNYHAMALMYPYGNPEYHATPPAEANTIEDKQDETGNS